MEGKMEGLRTSPEGYPIHEEKIVTHNDAFVKCRKRSIVGIKVVQIFLGILGQKKFLGVSQTHH